MIAAAVAERLTSTLRSLGYEVAAVDVAEIVWLAQYIPPARAEHPTSTSTLPSRTPDQSDGAATGVETQPESAPPVTETTVPGAMTGTDRTGLYPSTDHRASDVRRASIIRAPAAPALPNALALSRALRPLLKKKVSTREWQLDESATVDRTAANGGILSPVFRAGAERWFEIALVIDDAPSMYLWRQATIELRRLLTRHGGFRDLRQYRLRADVESASLISESGRVTRPDVIADPSGHRLIAIVTDAVSPAWQRRPLRSAICSWARLSPVVLIDVLPRRMWPLTATGFADRAMRAPRAGAPNVEWSADRDWWEPGGVPLPVMTLEAEQFARWAKSLMQVSATICTGTLLHAGDLPNPPRNPSSQSEASASERIQRFRSAASPVAYQLACYFAATQLVLPILRIVQRKMIPASGPGHLAEFLLSGLIYAVEPARGTRSGDPEKTVYEFHSGVRAILLDQLQEHEAPEVTQAIEDYLAAHLGQSYDLKALVLDAEGAETISAEALPFVTPAIELLERMGLRSRATSVLDRLIDTAAAHFGRERVMDHISREVGDLRRFSEETQRDYMLMAAIELMPDDQREQLYPLGVTEPVDALPGSLWRALIDARALEPLETMGGVSIDAGDRLRMKSEVRATLFRHVAKDSQRSLHKRIVDVYQGVRAAGFVPEDDGYFYEHYLKHVAAIKDDKIAEDLLLDADWISRKIQATSVADLIKDINRFPDNQHLRDLREAAAQKDARWEDPLEWAESLLRDWSTPAGYDPGAIADAEERERAKEQPSQASTAPRRWVLVLGARDPGGDRFDREYRFNRELLWAMGTVLESEGYGLLVGLARGTERGLEQGYSEARRSRQVPVEEAIVNVFESPQSPLAALHQAVERASAVIVVGKDRFQALAEASAAVRLLPIIPIGATAHATQALFTELVEIGEYFPDDVLNLDPEAEAAATKISRRVGVVLKERTVPQVRVLQVARAYAESRAVDHAKCEEHLMALLQRHPEVANQPFESATADVSQQVLQAFVYRVAPQPQWTAALVAHHPSIPLTLQRLKAVELAFEKEGLRSSLPADTEERLRAIYGRLDDEARGRLAGQAKSLLAQKLLPLARLLTSVKAASGPDFEDVQSLESPAVSDAMALDCLGDRHPGWRLVGLVRCATAPVANALPRILDALRFESTFPIHVRTALSAIGKLITRDNVDQLSEDQRLQIQKLADRFPIPATDLRRVFGLRSITEDIRYRLGLRQTPDVERLVRQTNSFLDASTWGARLAKLEPRVCRIELEGPVGTGFLVGRDLVLTCYHGLEHLIHGGIDDLRDVILRFDYRASPDGTIEQGSAERVAEIVDYTVAAPSDGQGADTDTLPHAGHMDYVLLRVAKPKGKKSIGRRPVGDNPENRAPGRGAVPIPASDWSFEPGSALFILHYSENQPLRLAVADPVIGLNANKTRVRYAINTAQGASGAPCFNQNLELVAMHQGGAQGDTISQFSQGIPIAAIRERLRLHHRLAGLALGK